MVWSRSSPSSAPAAVRTAVTAAARARRRPSGLWPPGSPEPVVGGRAVGTYGGGRGCGDRQGAGGSAGERCPGFGCLLPDRPRGPRRRVPHRGSAPAALSSVSAQRATSPNSTARQDGRGPADVGVEEVDGLPDEQAGREEPAVGGAAPAAGGGQPAQCAHQQRGPAAHQRGDPDEALFAEDEQIHVVRGEQRFALEGEPGARGVAAGGQAEGGVRVAVGGEALEADAGHRVVAPHAGGRRPQRVAVGHGPVGRVGDGGDAGEPFAHHLRPDPGAADEDHGHGGECGQGPHGAAQPGQQQDGADGHRGGDPGAAAERQRQRQQQRGGAAQGGGPQPVRGVRVGRRVPWPARRSARRRRPWTCP